MEYYKYQTTVGSSSKTGFEQVERTAVKADGAFFEKTVLANEKNGLVPCLHKNSSGKTSLSFEHYERCNSIGLKWIRNHRCECYELR